MYCGHIGIGLAVKGARPRIPLWVLLIAAFGPDWWETVLIAAGLPNTSLYSHSIPAVAMGALIFGFAVAVWRRSAADGAIVGALYVSHMLVDYLTGYKPLGFGGLSLGAQLYQTPIIDWSLETAIIVAGCFWYLRSLPDERAKRSVVAVGLPIALVLLQALYDKFFAHG